MFYVQHADRAESIILTTRFDNTVTCCTVTNRVQKGRMYRLNTDSLVIFLATWKLSIKWNKIESIFDANKNEDDS